MIKVCSGFSPAGRVQYGERFLSTFDRLMPADIALEVYVEEAMEMPRDACRDLWSIPGAREFHEAHATNFVAHGTVEREGWKHKDRLRGYSYRFDAYKFWKQILIPQAAANTMDDGDVLIWLDGDVEVIDRPSALDLLDLIGDADVTYLNRAPKHSEIGFWAVRLNERTRPFLARMAEIYTSGAVFDLPQWHSAFVWDVARTESNLSENRLCRPGMQGHVWPMTPLARWLRHDKGPRKLRARA
jgi:hypothetical protein